MHMKNTLDMKRRCAFWLLCLLLYTSCDRCEKEPIMEEDYAWGSKLAIEENGVQCTGSINGVPVILWLKGAIEKNILGRGTPFLCALFVAESDKVDKLAQAMQDHQVNTSQEDTSDSHPTDTLFPIKDSFVDYNRAEYRSSGKVEFAVFSPKYGEGLQPNAKYRVFLAMKAGAHVFYDADRYVNYETPNSSAITQVAMKDAKCDIFRDTKTGETSPDLSMKAQASRLSTADDTAAGFLLVEKDQEIQPLDLLETHLKKKKDSIADPFLQGNKSLTAHEPGIVSYCYGNPDSDGSFSVANDNDPDGILKKGGTYNSFALVEQHKKDAFRHFYVSSESKEIKIPGVMMEIVMESVGEPALWAYREREGVDYQIFKLEAEARGGIVKHENTEDPIAGFLFAPEDAGVLTEEATRNLVTGATSGFVSGAVPQFKEINEGGSDYLVCISQENDVVDNLVPFRGEFHKDDRTCYLDLTKDYRVYFWVRDAKGKGEVFVSKDHKEMKFFYSETCVGVDCTEEPKRNENQITIAFNATPGTEQNSTGAEYANAFWDSNNTPADDDTCVKTLGNYCVSAYAGEQEGESIFGADHWYKSPRGNPIYYKRVPYNQAETSIQIGNGGRTSLRPEREYDVYSLARVRNMIYITNHDERFKVPPEMTELTLGEPWDYQKVWDRVNEWKNRGKDMNNVLVLLRRLNKVQNFEKFIAAPNEGKIYGIKLNTDGGMTESTDLYEKKVVENEKNILLLAEIILSLSYSEGTDEYNLRLATFRTNNNDLLKSCTTGGSKARSRSSG